MSRSVDHAYASPKISDADSALASDSVQPTNVRHRIIAISICMSLLLYLDRNALESVRTSIVNDLGITNGDFGIGTKWFFWLYALFQVPAGMLADRFGARRMLTIYVIAWSLATIALGFVPGLFGLIGLRAVMGVAQAGAYPAAGSFLKRWANPTARAKANSFVAAGGRLGAVVAFALTALISIQFKEYFGIAQGWRGTLVLYGLFGIAWAAFFWWYFRDTPAVHPGCNDAEREIIGHVPPPAPAPLPVKAMLSNKNVWLLSFSGFLVNVGWIFLVTLQTVYILKTFLPQLQALFPHIKDPIELKAFQESAAGVATAAAVAAGMCGGVCGGFAADYFRRKLGPIWGRRVPGLLAGSLAGGGYLLCHLVTDVWVFVALMLVISFTIDFGLGSLWATYQDIGGRHVGSVLGFANMWGNIGAGQCGKYYSDLADRNQLPLVFTISAVALLLMSATWLLVDPTVTLPADEKESPQTT
jgi:MFS family permease